MNAPEHDDWIAETLRDAVDDLQPASGLASIRQRTRRPRRASGWAWGLGGAVVGTAAAAAIAVTLPESDRAIDDRGASRPERAESTDPSVGSRTVPAYFLGDTGAGPRLFREWYLVPTTSDTNVAALNLALQSEPEDPDYYSPWSGLDVSVQAVDQSPERIVVDLEGPADLAARPDAISEEQATLAVQQLVFTVQGALQSTNTVPVTFERDGSPLETLLGVRVGGGAEAGDPLAVKAPVWITQPFEGSAVPVGYTVEGQGAFFEATAAWELIAGGIVVADGTTMSQEGGVLSPYAFDIPDVPPGTYTLRVFAPDMSDGEGFGEFEDTKTITIETADRQDGEGDQG